VEVVAQVARDTVEGVDAVGAGVWALVAAMVGEVIIVRVRTDVDADLSHGIAE
jgi:hypothetical protein